MKKKCNPPMSQYRAGVEVCRCHGANLGHCSVLVEGGSSAELLGTNGEQGTVPTAHEDEPSLPVAPGPVPPHSSTCCPPKLSHIFLAAVSPAEEQPGTQQHRSPAPGSPGDTQQHAEGTDKSRSNWSLAFQLDKWGLSASQTLQ